MMWAFLEAHPVWGCVYLSIICFTVIMVFTFISRMRAKVDQEAMAWAKSSDEDKGKEESGPLH